MIKPVNNNYNSSSSILPPLIANLDKSKIFSVSKLNNTINQLLTDNFPVIYLEGEVSNLARPLSGHLYFTLKDEQSQIRCALFKGYRQFIKTKIENGQKILVKAKLSIYSPRGDYQLIIEHAYPTGLGALQQAYIELKNKLANEGLFDAKYKKSLPKLPKTIYVITSSTGAAIRDIITTLYNRFPSIPVKILPSIVQGDKAPADLIKSIKIANNIADANTDIIILARGGGSLEDLWAFNNEALARAIFNSKVPIISGVGHEVDFTIADFVADVRAATPTAAAMNACPDWQEYYVKIINLNNNLFKLINNNIINYINKLKFLIHRLKQQHPETKLLNQIQLIDDLYIKLVNSYYKNYDAKFNKINNINIKLQGYNPINKINIYLNQVAYYKNNFNKNIINILSNHNNLLSSNIHKLNAMNPLDVLARGYSIINKQSDDNKLNIITDKNQVKKGDKITATLFNGSIDCEVV